jgi:predicted transcriptional regulator
VAVELKLADILKDGPKRYDDLARETGTDPDVLSRVLRTLTSAGVFKSKKNGYFETNALGRHLQSDLEDSMYAFVKIVGEDWISDIWGDLLETTRSGKDHYRSKYGMSFFDWLKSNKEAQKEFDVGMTSISVISDVPVARAYDFSPFKSLVDIGGGHGSQLMTILKSHPGMKGILFDMSAPVSDLENGDIFKKEGLAGRVSCIAGDFFESIPAGYDAYFMKSILHDWDDERAIKILSNCRKAVRDDSVMLIVENVVKDDFNSSDLSKVLDINVLALMGGKVRTRDECAEILKAAGFALTRVIPTESPFTILEAKPI